MKAALLLGAFAVMVAFATSHEVQQLSGDNPPSRSTQHCNPLAPHAWPSRIINIQLPMYLPSDSEVNGL